MTCKDIHELVPLYRSGELDASRSVEFAAHVEGCAVCAHEMRSESGLDGRLRDGILADDLNTAALEQRIRQRIARTGSKTSSRWIGVAASIAAAFVVAGVAYRVFLGPQPGSVYADAAEDHRREVIDQQPRRWTSEGSAIEVLAQRQGVPSSAIQALSAHGYRLERGKLCRLDGRVFLHLVYSEGVREISVFLRQHETEPTGPAHAAYRGREQVAYCATERLTAVVVTDQSSDAALSLARFAAAAL